MLQDASWLGFVLSTQYFGVVVGSIFWGLVADYCGLRAVYLVLLFSDTILFFLSGLCESVLTLCFVRAGAGFCAIMPLGTAWVSATAPPDKQMIAFTFLFISIIGGFVTGSASGGLFAQIDSGVGLSGPNSGDGGWFSATTSSSILCFAAFLVIFLGTAAPPKETGLAKTESKPEGVKDAVTTLEFFTCCITAFLCQNEAGVITLIMTASLVWGFGYTTSGMSVIFAICASNLLVSSVAFAPWISGRTTPQQRVVILLFMTNIMIVANFLLLYMWQSDGGMPGNGVAGKYTETQCEVTCGTGSGSGGLVDDTCMTDCLAKPGSADILHMALVILLFVFQCVVGPTTMEIASTIAATQAKNANGTIMGMHQVIMNLGQAVGPLIGAAMLKSTWLADPIMGSSLCLPMVYLMVCEVCVLALNIFVFYRGDRKGRGLFDLSKVPQPGAEPKTDGVDPQVEGADEPLTPTGVDDVKVTVGEDGPDDLAQLRERKAADAAAAAKP